MLFLSVDRTVNTVYRAVYAAVCVIVQRRFFERLFLASLHLLTLSIAVYTRPDQIDDQPFTVSLDANSIVRLLIFLASTQHRRRSSVNYMGGKTFLLEKICMKN